MKYEIDLLNIGGVCQRAALPYSQTLRAMHVDPSFPKPALSQGNVKRWDANDIDTWAARHREKSLM